MGKAFEDMRYVMAFVLVLVGAAVVAQSKTYTFVFLHKRDQPELPKEQLDKVMAGHQANIQKMVKEKKLLVVGPFENGGGIFIFNTSLQEEVKEWLKPDPGMQINRWRVEMLPFVWRVGSPCAAKEPIEMAEYQFIRYTANIAKFNIQDAPELFGKHDDYLKGIYKTGNVMTDGTFGDSDGGILIMKGALEMAVIENDPAVREGLLEVEIKKLYLAKGVLCDK